jgi:hypothetical protein
LAKFKVSIEELISSQQKMAGATGFVSGCFIFVITVPIVTTEVHPIKPAYFYAGSQLTNQKSLII